MDEEDEGRVLRAVDIANMIDGYSAVLRAVQVHRTDAITPGQWRLYMAVQRAAQEAESDSRPVVFNG